MIRYSLFILAAFVGVASAQAQDTLSLSLDHRSILSNCWASQTRLEITFVDQADPTHNRSFAIRCRYDLVVDASEEAFLALGNGMVLDTRWPEASKWRIEKGDQSTTFHHIALEPGSYTFRAILWSRRGEETLSEKTFIYSRTSGASVKQLSVRRKTFWEALLERLVGRDTLYLSLITSLLFVLAGALKSRIQKFVEATLDYLGRHSTGWFADRRFRKLYADYLQTTHRYLRIPGFNAAAGISRPQLEQVFISLRVSPFDRTRAFDGASTDSGVGFEKAVARFSRIAILGGPGTGKTTTLSYIVLQLLGGRTAELFGTTAPLLPIFVPLRRVPSRDSSLVDDILSSDTGIIPSELLAEIPKDYIQRHLLKGRCVLLLDGLDEVMDQATHQIVAAKLNRLVKRYPGNRFIVTCRIAGWKELLDDFAVLETEDFNRTEVHRFVFGWHRAIITQEYKTQIELDMSGQEERADAWRKRRAEAENAIDQTARGLLNGIDGSGRLMAIATNPMLLSLICLVNYVKKMLPRERSVLYEKCVELLVDAWDRSRGIPSGMTISTGHKESILRAIAVALQRSGKGEAVRSEVESIIAAELNRLNLSLPPRDLLDQVVQRSGLLIERSIDVFGFSHLTLQEYMVAKWIQLNPGELTLLHENLDNQEWREVILLYAGLVDNATELVSRVMAKDVPARWLLAGYTLSEAKRAERALTEAILERLLAAFEMPPGPSDALLSVLAALCTDFADVATAPEQVLSARMLQHVNSRTPFAVPAIRVLGRSRITHAIPSLIDLIGSGVADLEEEAERSVVLFGNIALPLLIGRIRGHVDGIPVTRAIGIFRQIGTGQAARQMIQCYQYWTDARSHSEISLALAAMLDDELVAAELLDIADEELPAVVRLHPLRLPAVAWPFGDRATPASRHLLAKVRDDIAGWQSPQPSQTADEWDENTMGFRLKFTALLMILIERAGTIDRNGWRSLGFEAGNDKDVAVLNRVRRDVKSSRGTIETNIRRVLETRASDRGRSDVVRELAPWMRWLLRVTQSLVTLMVIAHTIMSVLLLYLSVFDQVREDVRESIAVFSALSLVVWIVTIVVAIRVSPKGEKWWAWLAPIGPVLRSLPYYPTGWPWLNFSLSQAAWLTFSLPSLFLVVVFWVDRVSPSIDWSFVGNSAAAGLGFVALNYLFFLNVALRVDASALLLLWHPAGRRLLGLHDILPATRSKVDEMRTLTVQAQTAGRE